MTTLSTTLDDTSFGNVIELEEEQDTEKKEQIDKNQGNKKKKEPFIITSVKDKLFQVIFLDNDGFHGRITDIIKLATKEITDTVFTKDSKFFYNIMVETLENMNKHTAISPKNMSNRQDTNPEKTERRFSDPEFSINKEDNEYTITVCNTCEKNDREKLISFQHILNGTSLDEIKEAYRDTMYQKTLSEKGGGGLGFLTIGKLIKNFNKQTPFNFLDVEKQGERTITTGIIRKVFDEKGKKSIETIPGEHTLIDVKITMHLPFPKPAHTPTDCYIDKDNSLSQTG